MKKSRRARKKKGDRRRSASARTGMSRTAAARPAAVVMVKEEQPAGPSADEYRYVVQDLKRVAVLAAAMFTMLVVLSFFIR